MWNRIITKFSVVVTSWEYSNFRSQARYIGAKGIEDGLSRKRPRTEGETSSSR